MGNLLYHLSTRFKGCAERRDTLLDYICTKRITSEPQLSGVCVVMSVCVCSLYQCMYIKAPVQWNLCIVITV